MLSDLQKKRVENLWQEGQRLLDEHAYEDALNIAEQLEHERFSGAFDLAAQAYAGLGKLSDAIATLERGVGLAPGAWLNWQLLGNYCSDAERFEDAAAAYEHALACENVWADSVWLNQAILAERRNQLHDALQTVDKVQDPALAFQKTDVKARLLLSIGKAEAAIDQCKGLTCPDEPTPGQRGCLARLCVTHAKALVALGERPEDLLEAIRVAILSYPEATELLSLFRQMRNKTSSHARLFKVVVGYGLNPSEQAEQRMAGFFRSGRVVADTAEEAVSLLRELEGDGLLALDGPPEIDALEEDAGSLKGVLTLSPCMTYAERE